MKTRARWFRTLSGCRACLGNRRCFTGFKECHWEYQPSWQGLKRVEAACLLFLEQQQNNNYRFHRRALEQMIPARAQETITFHGRSSEIGTDYSPFAEKGSLQLLFGNRWMEGIPPLLRDLWETQHQTGCVQEWRSFTGCYSKLVISSDVNWFWKCEPETCWLCPRFLDLTSWFGPRTSPLWDWCTWVWTFPVSSSNLLPWQPCRPSRSRWGRRGCHQVANYGENMGIIWENMRF